MLNNVPYVFLKKLARYFYLKGYWITRSGTFGVFFFRSRTWFSSVIKQGNEVCKEHFIIWSETKAEISKIQNFWHGKFWYFFILIQDENNYFLYNYRVTHFILLKWAKAASSFSAPIYHYYLYSCAYYSYMIL